MDPLGEVPKLEFRERPPSTLRNALTTGPWEVPELEVRKLETWMAGPLGVLAVGPTAAVDGGPSVGAVGMSGSGQHQSWRRH
jgi:hypothetical protein